MADRAGGLTKMSWREVSASRAFSQSQIARGETRFDAGFSEQAAQRDGIDFLDKFR